MKNYIDVVQETNMEIAAIEAKIRELENVMHEAQMEIYHYEDMIDHKREALSKERVNYKSRRGEYFHIMDDDEIVNVILEVGSIKGRKL